MSRGRKGRLVLIVEPDLDFADDTRILLDGDRVIAARSMDEAVEIAYGGRVDAAVLGPSFGTEAGALSAQQLLTADPDLAVVLVANVLTNRVLRAALRVGMADVLDTPLTLRKLSEALGAAIPAGAAPAVEVVMEAAVETTHRDTAESERQPRSPVAEEAVPSSEPATFSVASTAGFAVGGFFGEIAADREAEEFRPEEAAIETAVDVPEPTVADQVSETVAHSTLLAAVEPHAASATTDAKPGQGSPSAPIPADDRPFAPPQPAPVPVIDREEGAPAWFDRPEAGEPQPVAAEALPPDFPPMPPGPPPSVAEQEEPVPMRKPGGGEVITVMAGKGGSGKTVAATNLATVLSGHAGEDRVVVVDADLQFGDVALMLQLDPTRTLVDAARGIDELSEPRLDALLLRHESGLRVLPAPLVPVSAEEITPKTVVRLVEMLRGMFDFVVVDTSPIFDDGLITILDHSDQVLLVVDMDLPSVKNAKIALDTLRASGYDLDRIHLLVNRVNAKARLDLAEMERSLGLDVAAAVPSDRLIPQSVNEGVPAVVLSPRSKVSKAFQAVGRLFLPDD